MKNTKIHQSTNPSCLRHQSYDDKMKKSAEQKKNAKEATKFSVESPAAQKMIDALKEKSSKTKSKVGVSWRIWGELKTVLYRNVLKLNL